jgi:hypothetical protein
MALHPAKYWADATRDLPQRFSVAPASLPSGWSVLREDSLGELACGIVALPPKRRGGVDMSNPMALMGISFSNKESKGWDGDRLALCAKGEARLLRWRSVWDSEQDAAEFRAALESQLEHQRASAAKLRVQGVSGAELSTGLAATEVELVVWTGIEAAEELASLRAAGLFALVP